MSNPVQLYELENGRKYKVVNTGVPYVGGEYPSGGLKILMKLQSGDWGFLDHTPNQECIDNFMKAAKQLSPLA